MAPADAPLPLPLPGRSLHPVCETGGLFASPPKSGRARPPLQTKNMAEHPSAHIIEPPGSPLNSERPGRRGDTPARGEQEMPLTIVPYLLFTHRRSLFRNLPELVTAAPFLRLKHQQRSDCSPPVAGADCFAFAGSSLAAADASRV